MMKIAEVKFLLREIEKNEGKFDTKKLINKGFSESSIESCMNSDLIIPDQISHKFSLTDEGLSLLNQSDMAENTKKLSETMNNFSNESKISANENKISANRMNRYTVLLILLAIIQVAFAGVLLKDSQDTANQAKTEEINSLTAQIQSLNISLKGNIIALSNLKTAWSSNKTSTISLSTDTFAPVLINGNFRNNTIKLILSGVLFELDATENGIKIIDSPEFAQLYINSAEEYENSRIKSRNSILEEIKDKRLIEDLQLLRDLFASYNMCIAEKRDFNKC